ncbi:P-loop containing nucleoside triphosphate hydrolase protein [Ilyonectria sp. MPI-CAGE-AT-0026]|nr:P-loop containing nucleoside triphosphate hydrolase protein [Ilyonectria sp. MPI-CAGE-AT-0026]
MLPGRVGQLMVMYMLYIRPFTDRLQGSRWALYDKVYLPSDFIWHQPESPGTPWDSSQLSRALAKWSQHYAGQRITLQQWRHIAIAIGRRHTRARGAQRANFNEAGEAEAEEEEAESYEDVEDLAAAHTSRTAAGYGVTIDILKRLTSESLEVFGQASRRWHCFLGCSGGAAAAEVEAETAEAAEGLEGSAAKEAVLLLPEAGLKKKRRLTAGSELLSKAEKRQQVSSWPIALEQLQASDSGSGSNSPSPAIHDRLLRRALQQALRNEDADFRSAEQKEAIQRAAAKQTPLVAILPTGAGKSLVFMVPALLIGAGMTIVVVPFRALKAQLVSRCREAGLTCSAWPEAQDLWPTVTIISAEAAVSETFLQWAAGLTTYRGRLRRLTLLRGLCCPLVFLTATLPLYKQPDFEAAMLLRNPIYIRASSHRLNLQFKVYKVQNGRGIREVKELVAARAKTLRPGEKGIVFCRSHASCKAVALQLGCCYYHGEPDDPDAAFLAQRDSGFEDWVEGRTPYIVATAALGTGLDVAAVVHIIHLDLPWCILSYIQKAGRAGRAGEQAVAEVIVEERNWPLGNPTQEVYWEEEQQEIGSLIWTQGCRRYILGRYMDGDYRSCRAISPDAVLCDNCQHQQQQQQGEPLALGPALLQAQGQQSSRELAAIEAALEEIDSLALGLGLGKAGRMGCRPCWLLYGAAEARHSWYRCPRLEGGTEAEGTEGTEAAAAAEGEGEGELCLPFFADAMQFQSGIRYQAGRQGKCLSCFYCHLSQTLCPEGYKDQGRSCRYKHIVLPLAFIAFTQLPIRAWMEKEIVKRALQDKRDYQNWLGQRHLQLIGGVEMTNAIALFSWLIQQQQQQEGEEDRGNRKEGEREGERERKREKEEERKGEREGERG